ncbi:hypothetical protein [Thalassobacillus hwangdonensis]
MLLRTPRLVIEIKEGKTWCFDWAKFIPIAVPAIFMLTVSLSTNISTPLTALGISVPGLLINGQKELSIIAGIVLGYSLLDSLKR